MQNVPFTQIVGSTYTLASLNAECQRCVNLMPETIESGQGANQYYLRETPGLKLFLDITSQNPIVLVGPPPDVYGLNILGTIKALHTCGNGRVFFIALADYLINGVVVTAGRPQLFELLANGTIIHRITFAVGPEHNYKLIENSSQLFIMADQSTFSTKLPYKGLASLIFATNGVRAITYERFALLGTKWIVFLDQYLITTVMNPVTGLLTNQFQISGLAITDPNVNNVSWDALKVFSAETSNDLITGLVVNGRELWVFGASTYEVWFNPGITLSTFQRISGAAYNIGCQSPETILAFQGSVFWLGASEEGYGIVWKSQGNQAVRISTTAIEKEIASFADISNAFAWTYQDAGHICYVLSFPDNAKTFVYDLLVGLWHERSYRNPDTQVVTCHRGRYQIFAFGKNLVSDLDQPYIYELSPTTYTDNFAPIIRYRRAPATGEGLRRIFYKKLELNMQVGVGIGAIPLPNPVESNHDYSTTNWQEIDPNWAFFGDEDFTTYPGYMTGAGDGDSGGGEFTPAASSFTTWPAIPVVGTPLNVQYELRILLNAPASNIPCAFPFFMGNGVGDDNFTPDIFYSLGDDKYYLEVYGSKAGVPFDDVYEIFDGLQADKTFIIKVSVSPTALQIRVDGILTASYVGMVFSNIAIIEMYAQRTNSTNLAMIGDTRIWTDEPPLGLYGEQDPKISVRWSDDNGYTWSNYKTISLGKQGNYLQDVVMTQLGAAKHRVFEVYYNEATPFRLISAELGIEVGLH